MAMARIQLGNRDGAFALRQARGVLEQLTDEWPDVNFALRTVHASDGGEDALLRALLDGTVGVAVVAMETLPLSLPEGVTLAAVARRGEPRSALVAKGQRSLEELPAGARVGVPGRRDVAFLTARRADLDVRTVGGRLEDDLGLITAGELDALVLPAAALVALDRRNRIDALLEPSIFAPAPGQGALGLLVRGDDDLAFEIAYSLQHRASYDRAIAERGFARAMRDAGDAPEAVGAYATVSDEGELSLFGAVAEGGHTVQARVAGAARAAEALAGELAADVRRQWAAT